MRLVMDSACNLNDLAGIDFKIVPLTICTEDKEYYDNEDLDALGMVSDLEKIKKESHTACPGVNAWLKAFEGEDEIIAVTLSGSLSGAYSTCLKAAEIYMEENPKSVVFVLDSGSVGPVERLIGEFLAKGGDLSVEDAWIELQEYARYHLKTAVCSNNLKNLVRCGRITKPFSKFTHFFKPHAVGEIAPSGKIRAKDRVHSEKRALSAIFKNMKSSGYEGGHVVIDHCDGTGLALKLKELITKEFPKAIVDIGTTKGVLSFYTLRGGFVVGYEV